MATLSHPHGASLPGISAPLIATEPSPGAARPVRSDEHHRWCGQHMDRRGRHTRRDSARLRRQRRSQLSRATARPRRSAAPCLCGLRRGCSDCSRRPATATAGPTVVASRPCNQRSSGRSRRLGSNTTRYAAHFRRSRAFAQRSCPARDRNTHHVPDTRRHGGSDARRERLLEPARSAALWTSWEGVPSSSAAPAFAQMRALKRRLGV
jgi:hypothetical protein